MAPCTPPRRPTATRSGVSVVSKMPRCIRLRICTSVSALPTVEAAHTQHALRFDMTLEENPAWLHEELEGSTDHPSRSVCFVVKQPRFQKIIAADLRDRVVHHV